METTLNIRSDILEKINHAALAGGMSRSDMIVQLLKQVMINMPHAEGMGRLVQYQHKCCPDSWRNVHVSLRMDDYEYFLDLRKLLKMSVSLILAYAVKIYLNTIMKKKSTDNYQFKNYILAKTVINNIICWKLIWGYPPDLEKFLTF